MAGVEEDAEERVAEVPVDDRLQRAAHLTDVQRPVPLGDRLEVRADEPLDVVADRRRAAPPASSTTNPARQLSAPQMPNAVVNGSPRSIGRSPGLSSPNRARGPAVSIRWHESGAPFHSSSRTASRSVIPGRSPASRLRTPCDVWHAAHSNAASCSTSLTTRSPSAASMSRSVAFSTRPAGPVRPAQLVDEERRRLDDVPAGVRLPADDADAAARR